MGNIVNEWYETKKNVDEMVHWEKPKLKKWELAVTEFFPAEAKILDVGCGLGREAFVLSDMGYKVTGIDISQEVIDQVVPFSVQKGYDMTVSYTHLMRNICSSFPWCSRILSFWRFHWGKMLSLIHI